MNNDVPSDFFAEMPDEQLTELTQFGLVSTMVDLYKETVPDAAYRIVDDVDGDDRLARALAIRTFEVTGPEMKEMAMECELFTVDREQHRLVERRPLQVAIDLDTGPTVDGMAAFDRDDHINLCCLLGQVANGGGQDLDRDIRITLAVESLDVLRTYDSVQYWRRDVMAVINDRFTNTLEHLSGGRPDGYESGVYGQASAGRFFARLDDDGDRTIQLIDRHQGQMSSFWLRDSGEPLHDSDVPPDFSPDMVSILLAITDPDQVTSISRSDFESALDQVEDAVASLPRRGPRSMRTGIPGTVDDLPSDWRQEL